MPNYTAFEAGTEQSRPALSLNGIASGQGRGRGIETQNIVLTTAVAQQVLGVNPLRSWAIIFNPNANVVTLSFGSQSALPAVVLTQYGSYTIDDNMPWSGGMTALQSSGGDVTIYVSDVSVIQ